jgi:hypothetical protein
MLPVHNFLYPLLLTFNMFLLSAVYKIYKCFRFYQNTELYSASVSLRHYEVVSTPGQNHLSYAYSNNVA